MPSVFGLDELKRVVARPDPDHAGNFEHGLESDALLSRVTVALGLPALGAASNLTEGFHIAPGEAALVA